MSIQLWLLVSDSLDLISFCNFCYNTDQKKPHLGLGGLCSGSYTEVGEEKSSQIISEEIPSVLYSISFTIQKLKLLLHHFVCPSHQLRFIAKSLLICLRLASENPLLSVILGSQIWLLLKSKHYLLYTDFTPSSSLNLSDFPCYSISYPYRKYNFTHS